MTRITLLAGLLSAAFFFPAAAVAQHKPLPPPKDVKIDSVKQRQAPPLALPEYVITGADIIRMNENSKNALEAYDASSLVVRAGRGMRESFRGAPALAIAPLQLPPLQGRASSFLLRAGFGRFSTPSIALAAAHQFDRGDVSATAWYGSTLGHVAGADNIEAGFDLKAGSFFPVSSQPLIARSRLQGDLAFSHAEYNLYADKLPPQSPTLRFNRRRNSFAVDADLISRKNTVIQHSLSIGLTHGFLSETMAVSDSFAGGGTRFAETDVHLAATARASVLGHPVDASLRSIFSANTRMWPYHQHNPLFLTAGARSQIWLRDDMAIEAGATAYVFRGSKDAAQMRLYPDLLLRYYLDDALSCHVSFIPRIERTTFASLLNDNPYVMLGAELRHTDVRIAPAFGIAYDDRRRLALRATAEYSELGQSGYMQHLPAPLNMQWDIVHRGSNSVFALSGDAQWQASAADRVQVWAVVRSSYNTFLDTPIPYLPMADLRAHYTRSFAIPLEITGELRLLGPREAGGISLPVALLIGALGEYRFSEHAGAFLSLQNLLSVKYETYRGYSARPLFISAGVTAKF